MISLAPTSPSSAPRAIVALHAAPLWVSLLASLFLLGIAVLALPLTIRATSADRAALLFLAVSATILFWTPARKYFERDTREAHNAASFFLMAAMFVIYSLARRSGPEAGWSHEFALLPDEPIVFSHAMRVAVLGALVTLPFGLKVLGGQVRALLIGAFILGILAIGTFRLMAGYYKIGVTEILDPTALVQILLQLVEYASLAILCAIATANIAVRAWLLRVLPIVLLALWARHQFSAPLPVEEDEE